VCLRGLSAPSRRNY